MAWANLLTDPLHPPQCYGLWDHEEDRFSKEHHRNSGKDQEAKEESETVLGPQPQADSRHPEKLGLTGAPKDHILSKVSVKSKDEISESLEDLKPQESRPISLRLRRKETPGPKGAAAIGKS